MKTRLAIGIAAALLGLAGCTSAETSAQASTGGIQGSCINPVDIKTQKIVSDQEIQFEMKNGDTWTNKLANSCFGLKLEGGFSWEVQGSLVCSNQQRITVQNTGTPCLLGAFTKTAAKTS
ncbi:MAG TPA: hypothetical protein VGO52_23370 [Hyphomonadaceae bacterium]|jgi:hypothetical protein|nr:hypothetical protein [Hyphomonadaceae bacterium]